MWCHSHEEKNLKRHKRCSISEEGRRAQSFTWAICAFVVQQQGRSSEN